MPKAECRARLDEYEEDVVKWPAPQEDLSGGGGNPVGMECGMSLARFFGYVRPADETVKEGLRPPDLPQVSQLPAKLKSREIVFIHLF